MRTVSLEYLWPKAPRSNELERGLKKRDDGLVVRTKRSKSTLNSKR